LNLLLVTNGFAFERGVALSEEQIDRPDRTVALLPDDDLGLSLERIAVLVLRPFVDLGAVDEQHEIRVLLDGARLAQVRELRPLALRAALLRRTRQLRQRDHRNIELLREPLERP